MKRRRSNAGLFERLRGPSSVSYAGELRKRRHQAKLDAARQRESEREEIRRERQKVRDANKMKRQMLAEERREETKRRKEEAREAPHKAIPSASAIQRAYERGAKSLSEAMEMARSNPKGTKGRFERCVKAVSERGGAIDPRAVCGAQEKKYRGNPTNPTIYQALTEKLGRIPTNPELRAEVARIKEEALVEAGTKGKLSWQRRRNSRNPADSAVEAYKIFHGREPEELITIAKQRHYHKHLAAAGELERLVIEYPVGNGRKVQPVTLTQFKGALLAFNEQALPELARKGKVKITQLFIEGGDQTVNLEDFGIDPENVHEIETLGKAVKIDYFTTKDHLGSEGGTATYGHKFRSTNKDGKHVTVKIAKYPDVIYRVRDNQLEFSGGSYEIRAEGIDK